MPDSQKSQSQTIRSKRPAPRGNAAYPRKRAITACEVCRARRTKCDNQRPACGFCSRIGAKCNYSSEAEDYSAYDSASLRILERLDDLEVLLRRPVHSTIEAASLTTGRQQTTFHTEHRSWLLPSSPDVLLFSLAHVDTSEHQLLHTLVSPITNPDTSSLSLRSPSAIADLDTASSRQLVDNFFNYVHVKNPILQEERTRRTVSQLCLYGADWTTESCLALLICALGCVATPFGDSSEVTPGSPAYLMSQSYFQAAQRRLGNCLASSGLIEAQCLFLAGVYQMCIFRPFDAWRLFSQSLSCCQSFTFLRDQNTFEHPGSESLSSLDNSHVAEQAVYWSAWKSELELRSHWNMTDFPTPQTGIQYPPFFPTPPSPTTYHEDDDQSGARALRENIGWYFYLSEISLKRLMSRMSDEISQFEARNDLDLLEGLADSLFDRVSDLEAWIGALPQPISLETAPELDDVCKFVLRGQLINAYEMLYWPFLAYYMQEANQQPGQLLSRSSAFRSQCREHAETALKWHTERMRVNKPGFYHRHHGTWFMIGSCTRSVIMLHKARRFNWSCPSSHDLSMPDGWQEAVMEGTSLNAFWQNEAPDARRRLPQLEALAQEIGVSASANLIQTQIGND